MKRKSMPQLSGLINAGCRCPSRYTLLMASTSRNAMSECSVPGVRCFLPQRIAEAVPGRSEAHFVGVGVLNDRPLRAIGVTGEDTKAQRPAMVLHETEADEFFLRQQCLHHCRNLVKWVGILLRVRHVAVAETRIVHRDNGEIIGQCRNEGAVLVRRGREAMQQDEIRAAGLTDFAVEDVEPRWCSSTLPLPSCWIYIHVTLPPCAAVGWGRVNLRKPRPLRTLRRHGQA